MLDTVTVDLPEALLTETFLAGGYDLVVLPQRVRTGADYLRARRTGRGVALNRARRREVWRLIETYRAQGAVEGTLDFQEAAAIAAEHLAGPDTGDGGKGGTGRPVADHALVDEGQDLTPAHWQLLRAAVAPGPDDLFIADDVHQRIYGPRTVLSHYGIEIRGRSRRLTLNYRTTEQNLRYALEVLEGGEYLGLEEEREAPGELDYRSARSGPLPVLQEVSSNAEQAAVIAEHIRAWLGAGVSASTIAVLVNDRYARERVIDGLAEHDIEARAVERGRPPTGKVLVMTMHRAKGMEFANVVLADVAPTASEQRWLAELDRADREDAELRRRSLVYVAATRARDELLVISRV